MIRTRFDMGAASSTTGAGRVAFPECATSAAVLFDGVDAPPLEPTPSGEPPAREPPTKPPPPAKEPEPIPASPPIQDPPKEPSEPGQPPPRIQDPPAPSFVVSSLARRPRVQEASGTRAIVPA